MTSSSRRPVASAAPRRRIAALALVTLALVGAATPAAYADPDTNIQKPGHGSVR